MKYLLLIYVDDRGATAAPEAEMARWMAAYEAYTAGMKEAGAFVSANRLGPTGAAKTVRSVKGKTTVVDGPFTETKEHIGGYYLIDAASLDEALAWASRCPAAQHGAVEVRPVVGT